MRLAERYPFQKIFRIAEEKDKTDAQALEKVFADAGYMEAVVDLKAKAPAVYLYLNKDVPERYALWYGRRSGIYPHSTAEKEGAEKTVKWSEMRGAGSRRESTITKKESLVEQPFNSCK